MLQEELPKNPDDASDEQIDMLCEGLRDGTIDAMSGKVRGYLNQLNAPNAGYPRHYELRDKVMSAYVGRRI